ncbi:CAAX protease self-immunity [Bacillus sp. cl95]|nr:CAAX protease self-immunity [Bacillus sp. UNCCL13]SFQ90909.1 CAAX protease self-immunity [Bacillus sp. cl95]
MIVSKLTQHLTKKLLFALLIITIGTEAILYMSRFSSFMTTVYEGVLIASFFVGLKLHRMLRDDRKPPLTKLQLIQQFAKVYLIFSIGSSVFNVFSVIAFDDFSTEYDETVEEYADSISVFGEELSAGEYGDEVPAFFQWIDYIGYDFYSNTLAGLEEVYRLGYMILFLLIFKKVFPKRFEGETDRGSTDIFLMFALFLSSILFGFSHTFDFEYEWGYTIGSAVTYTNLGFLFGVLLLWTRNLWLLVIVHSVYDITATLSNYYYENTSILFDGLMILTYVGLAIVGSQMKPPSTIESEMKDEAQESAI